MSEKFDFKELDEEGLQTLEVISDADNFNEWTYDMVSKHCHGKILEIGSGIGNISSYFLRDHADITLSDIRENYRNFLNKKFADHHPNVVFIDVVAKNFDALYKDHIGQYDSVFALNVVEHIEDDQLAITNATKLLKKDGNLVILVPAFMSLYNRFDEELFHFRRYTKKTLRQLKTDRLDIVHSQYFNFIGIFGWFVTGKLMRKKIIPKGQMSLFNTLTPIFKVIDTLIFKSLGLSVMTVFKKR